MKLAVLMGSSRRRGNTNALLEPFLEEWEGLGHQAEVFWLYEMDLRGCTACRTCQRDWTGFGCAIHDGMQEVFDGVQAAEGLLLACPIYCWYCTAPMKAALDRLMYGMNKFYGETRGPALWAGKHMALITTCGYRPERGADLFEEGMRRYCKHSSLVYDGMLSERDLGYQTTFLDPEKVQRARAFAHTLAERMGR